MKNKIITIILSSLAFLSINTYNLTTKGQSVDGCYMEDVNGQTIDLSNLCGGGSSGSAKIRTNKNNFQIRIKRRQSGIPVVEVMFNGKKSYDMLLDTGASGTVLTIRMAEDLGLSPEGIVLANTAGGVAAFGVTTLDSLKIGNAVLRNLEVAVSSDLHIGLLGQDVFGRYDITIRKDVIEFQRRR